MNAAFSPDGAASSPPPATRRRGCGTPPPASRLPSSRHRGTVRAPRSAPTAPASSPPAGTRRRGSGTPPPARRSPSLRAQATRCERRVQPRRRPRRHRQLRQTARVWDAATGKPLAVLDGHSKVVNSAAFSPDGAASSPPPATTPRGCGTPPPASRSPPRWAQAEWSQRRVQSRRRRVVTACDDKTARVWDAATGKAARRPRASGHGHERRVQSRRRPRRHRLRDKTARVWDAATGKPLVVLEHGDSVWGAAFSPDGSRVVTASDDKTARVWDAANGKRSHPRGTGTGLVRRVQPRRRPHRHRL